MVLGVKKEEKKTEAEKVEERREAVLATGRKFKYPLQYTKHRIVINTILIAFVAVALLIAGGWVALYKIQMTNDVLYRVTRILPIDVAKVDGMSVRFADYLMLYRSSIIAMERQSGNLGTDEAAEELKTQYRRTALTEAEQCVYAMKIGEKLGVTVSEEEIDAEFERHRNVGGVERSLESFLKIVEDNFGLSETEYRRILYLNLIKAKVAAEVDTEAQETVNKIEKLLSENGNDYQKVAEELGGAVVYENTGGMVDNKNIDGGRATKAASLAAGESSGKFRSLNGDGYYFVKLIDKTETEVNFVSLKVTFKKFNEEFNKLVESGQVVEYISLDSK